MKKALSILLSITIMLCVFMPQMAFANESAVTNAMCKASYWKQKSQNANDVLMNWDEIATVNQEAIDGAGTKVFDITTFANTYNAESSRNSLSNSLKYDANDWYKARPLYVDQVKIDNESYFNNMANAVYNTAYTGTVQTQYAVCTQFAELLAYPMAGFLGYSANDCDDEKVNAGLVVNEPVVIRQKCENDGKIFYYCYSTNCTGWIDSESLAICSSKEEWLDAWQVKLDSSDFIVITQDKLTLEPSNSTPNVANTKVTLGTILKLVDEKDIPKNFAERGPWHNYVVYFPVRNDDGTYKKEMALIAQHYSVSVGFLPLTEANLLDVAFSCLGNRYGWAGMLDSFDCSLYTRTIFRCFGFELPRNTTWQQLVPNTLIDMSNMTDDEKQALLETMPVGSMLFFPGHTMMYIGSDNGVGYVISATGSLSDSQGDLDIRSMYSVIITPLTVRRANSHTWLSELNSVVCVVPKTDISTCDITVSKMEGSNDTNIIVKNANKTLNNNINYTVSLNENKATIAGINNYTGSKTCDVKIIKEPTKDNEYKITDGKNSTINKGNNSSLTFKSNADFAKFVCVKVDGQIVDSSNYIIQEGSTIVTLKSSYIDSLEAGTHTLEIVSTDGIASTTFEVTQKSNTAQTNTQNTTNNKFGISPNSGNEHEILIGVFILFVGIAIGRLTTLKRKKA